MSRASGRSYADFFPTAPSVLQEKKKLAQTRRKSTTEPSATPVQCDLQKSPYSSVHHASDQPHSPRAHLTLGNNIDQDGKHSPARDAGDLLNGVGSASSLTSNGSSIFSTAGPVASNFSHNDVSAMSSELTPLTSHEFSPERRSSTPRGPKENLSKPETNGYTSLNEQFESTQKTSRAITPAATPHQSQISPRPKPGLPRGIKVIHDPELDNKISSKDKRKLKIRYEPITEEVYLSQ